MLDLAQTIQRLGGVARSAQLQALGFSRTQLSRHARSGTIDCVRSGFYATPELDESVRTAIAHGGALSCASVLRIHRIWMLDDDHRPHVWVGPHGRVHSHSSCNCLSHFHIGKPPLGRASLEVALLHYRRCAGDEAFFAAFESALSKRLLSKAARQRVRAALPQSARWLVDLARSDADSGLESVLRLRLHILGIRLDCQVQVAGVGRVDFVVGGRLIIEADGKLNHDGPSMRHKDLTRDAAASAQGFETLRFDYAQIVYDWTRVQSSILAALNRLEERV